MSRFATTLDRCASEPFRLFFPLGLLASVIGALLWPAYYAGWISDYPHEAHARWMVFGFGGCFVIGFIGTAGPRLLGADPWCRFELLLHGAMAIAVMACLSFNQIPSADLLTGLWMLGVLKSQLFRLFVGRQDVPPPGMPLALLGIACASVAGIALSMDPILSYSLPVRSFWRLLYFQAFLWLPILGVAPYLLPRFLGRKSLHAFDDSLTLPSGWLRPFLESLAAGLLLIASFVIEVWISPRGGMIMRAVLVSLYLARAVPGLVSWSKVNGLGRGIRWVAPCSAAGWLLGAWFLPFRAGMLHMMFISGAGLLMISVATRVTLGHNSRHDRLASPMKWFNIVWASIVFTAATRLTSDFIPRLRVTHFIYAAGLWVIVLAFWAWKLRRERSLPIFEEGVSGKSCPRRQRAALRSEAEKSA